MFWLSLLELLIFFHQNEPVGSRLLYKKFEGKMNAKFIEANLSVGFVNEVSTMSAEINVLRKLDNHFQLRSSMSEIGKSGKRMLVGTPRLPYCHLLNFATVIPIVSDVIKESFKFGNFPTTCPIQPGHYYMTNFFVNDSKLPVQKLLANGKTYLVESWFWDKLKNSAVQIFKFDAIFVFFDDSKQ